jgi:hypothetical protein
LWLVLERPFDDRSNLAEAYRLVIAGYTEAAVNTAILAATVGALGTVVALGLGAAWSSRAVLPRAIASVQALGWFIMAVLPAPLVAALLEEAFNRPALSSWIYRTPAIMVIGATARFAFVAAVIGWWAASQESREGRAMREIDGALTLTGQWQASRPRWVAAATAAFAVTAVLSIGEVLISAQVQPPGFEALARILLNNMHYQRDDLVVLVAMLLYACAAAAALATTGAIWLGRRRTSSV